MLSLCQLLATFQGLSDIARWWLTKVKAPGEGLGTEERGKANGTEGTLTPVVGRAPGVA